MLIDCPDCAVRYELVDAELPPGRRTRCVRCGRIWTPVPASMPSRPEPTLAPTPAASPTVPEPPAPPEPPTIHRPIPTRGLPPLPRETRSFPPIPLPEPPRRRKPLMTAGFVGLGVLVAVAFLAFRAEAEAVWPPIARLYGALGLG